MFFHVICHRYDSISLGSARISVKILSSSRHAFLPLSSEKSETKLGFICALMITDFGGIHFQIGKFAK